MLLVGNGIGDGGAHDVVYWSDVVVLLLAFLETEDVNVCMDEHEIARDDSPCCISNS